MKIRFFICCLLLLILISPGCTKKKVETIYIPEYLKQYAVFQIGSFWVFKNEKTGEIDSSFIASPPYFSFYQNYPSDPRIQECYIDYGGTFISSGKLGYIGYSIGFKIGTDGTCLKYKAFKPGSVVYDGSMEIYKELGIYDSLVINNVVYYHVLNTQYQYPKNNGDTDYLTFYLEKSIGLIKFNYNYLHQDTTWSLLRYHVIQ